MIIDQAYAGHQIQLSVGQVAELRLPENRTTGYRWTVTSADSPACSLAEEGFHVEPGPPGQGGEHVWRLTAAAPGSCDIQLTYRRSFAPDAPGNTVFTLHLRVTEEPAR